MAEPSLWSEDDQRNRLAELCAPSSDPAKELPLRRDVRSLGTLLGRVLVEQESEAFFGVVEQLRRLLIQHREQLGNPVPVLAVAGAARRAEPSLSSSSIPSSSYSSSSQPLSNWLRLTGSTANG